MINEARKLLKQYFGYEDFRLGQAKIIESILNKKNTLGIMPTGGGKSICYEIPALCFDGLTIVISPLISLMKDQIDALNNINYPAGMINSTVDYGTQQRIKRQAEVGAIKLLYLTPERCASKNFIEWLQTLNISLFCVDECHCISEWGHDFRVEYRKLADVIQAIGNPPTLALTATATTEVQEDIVKSLRMKNPNIFVSGFNRDNLIYGIQIHDNQENKNKELINFLGKVATPGIIYVSAVKTGQLLLNILNTSLPNKKIGLYHGGLDTITRKRVQDDFFNDKIEILIATNAFGMGVNKSNIRFVVHYTIPGTIESYYQETGRAGRDGKLSYCLLMYLQQDERIQQYFIEAKNPTIDDMTYLLSEIVRLSKHETVYVEDLSSHISDKKISPFKIDAVIKQLETLEFIEESNIASSSVEIEIMKQLKNEELELLYNEIVNLSEYNKLKVNLRYLATRLDSTERDIITGLDKLQKSHTIKYTLIKAGHILKVLREKFSKKDIEEYTEHTKQKISFDKSKFKHVVTYSLKNECRRKFLLNYFGEEYTEQNCGKCDICRGTHKTTTEKLVLSELHTQLLTFFLNHNNKIGRRNAVKILVGAYDLDVKYRDWDEYGSLKKYKQDEIEKSLNALFYSNLLTTSNGKYPVVILSDNGLAQLKKAFIKKRK